VCLDDEAVARMHAVIEVSGDEVRGDRPRERDGHGAQRRAHRQERGAQRRGRADVRAVPARGGLRASGRGGRAAPPAPWPRRWRRQLDAREFEVQNGSRVAQVTAMFNNTVIDVQHLGQTQDRRKSAPAWLALGGVIALAGAALFGMEAAQDWDAYSERTIAAAEAGKPAPAKPGNGLGGLGFGLAMLGLVPIGVGFTRMQDRGRRTYTLGEGHDAPMHVPAATLPGGERSRWSPATVTTRCSSPPRCRASSPSTAPASRSPS
jgi:hypothetical protein